MTSFVDLGLPATLVATVIWCSSSSSRNRIIVYEAYTKEYFNGYVDKNTGGHTDDELHTSELTIGWE